MNMWQVTAQEQASEGWSALFCTHTGCIQMQTPHHTFFRGEKEAEAQTCPESSTRFLSHVEDFRHQGQVWQQGGVKEAGGRIVTWEVNRDEILLRLSGRICTRMRTAGTSGSTLKLFIHFLVSMRHLWDESDIFLFHFLRQIRWAWTSS